MAVGHSLLKGGMPMGNKALRYIVGLLLAFALAVLLAPKAC